jgi:hypothetical protein
MLLVDADFMFAMLKLVELQGSSLGDPSP